MFTSCSKKSNFIGVWDVCELMINDQQQTVVPAYISVNKAKASFKKMSLEVNGNSGVNSFFGDIYIEKDKFNVDDKFGSTKMMGAPKEQNFEDLFMNIFMNSDSYKLEDDVLTINCEMLNSYIKLQKRK